MNIEYMKEFIVFSESLNYTSAAKELFIAQSTLSLSLIHIFLVGCAVLVPFGHRQAVGFVVALEEAGAAASEGPGADSEEAPHEAHYGFGAQYEDAGPRPRRSHAGIDLGRLKPIVRALSKPYFDEEGAACAQWLSERYLAPLSSCVRLFTPPGGVPRMVRAREGYWRLEEPAVGEVDDRWVVPGPAFGSFEPRKNAVKQASIVAALRSGELRVAELTAEFGAVSSPLKALSVTLPVTV